MPIVFTADGGARELEAEGVAAGTGGAGRRELEQRRCDDEKTQLRRVQEKEKEIQQQKGEVERVRREGEKLQEQLAAKVGKWRFGEGTSLMDAMWQRSREERVHSIVSADLDVLRERESINLDDTALEVIRHDIVAIWIECFSRSPRCRC